MKFIVEVKIETNDSAYWTKKVIREVVEDALQNLVGVKKTRVRKIDLD